MNRERWRKYRPAWVSAVIVVFFVLLLSVVAAVVPSPHSEADNASSTPVRSLLLQIRDQDKRGVGAVIISELMGASGAVAITTTPVNLSLTLADGTQVNLPDVTVPPYPQQAVDGLRTTAGLGVDGQLVLERLGFAGLVDYVGGVNIRIDAQFTSTSTDLQQVVIKPGLRHLRGIDALAYLGEGNPQLTPAQQDSHMRQVAEQLLRRLPTDPFRVNQVLVSAGLGARSSVPTDELSDLLSMAGRSARRGSLQWNRLPTVTQKLGAATVAVVDQSRAAQFADTHSLPTSTEFGDMPLTRVVVRDGTGVPDAALGVREAVARVEGVAAVADTLRANQGMKSPRTSTLFLARSLQAPAVIEVSDALDVPPTQARSGQLPLGVDAVIIVGLDLLTSLRQGL